MKGNGILGSMTNNQVSMMMLKTLKKKGENSTVGDGVSSKDGFTDLSVFHINEEVEDNEQSAKLIVGNSPHHASNIIEDAWTPKGRRSRIDQSGSFCESDSKQNRFQITQQLVSNESPRSGNRSLGKVPQGSHNKNKSAMTYTVDKDKGSSNFN